jgi:hypothetical protein
MNSSKKEIVYVSGKLLPSLVFLDRVPVLVSLDLPVSRQIEAKFGQSLARNAGWCRYKEQHPGCQG